MPWSAYALFVILSTLFGFGISRIFYGDENPAHTTRLGNVRAVPVEVPEPRPNRFALEEDMESLTAPSISTPEQTQDPALPEYDNETPIDAEIEDLTSELNTSHPLFSYST